jgi:hypothetical protein
MRGGRIERIAEFEVAHRFAKRGLELIGNSVLHIDSGICYASLSGYECYAEYSVLNGLLDVGIVENDGWAFPAKSEGVSIL